MWFIHGGSWAEDRLRANEAKLDLINERITAMSVTLDRATASLEKLNNAATAIEKVLDMVVEEVKATGTDDPKVLAALDAIDAKSDEIVAKALANTPAASQVPPPA